MAGRLRGLPSKPDQQAVALDLRTGHCRLPTGAVVDRSRTVEFVGQLRSANNLTQLGGDRHCLFAPVLPEAVT